MQESGITNGVLHEQIKNISEQFKEWREFNDKRIACSEENLEKIEIRVDSLEKWKLVFVAKFTIYSAIGVFLGSTIGIILSQLISWSLKIKLGI